MLKMTVSINNQSIRKGLGKQKMMHVVCPICLPKQTPLHQALLEGKEDAIKLLLRYGADLNKKDSSGHSPINLAHRISVERYIKLFDQEKGEAYLWLSRFAYRTLQRFALFFFLMYDKQVWANKAMD